MWAGPSCVPPAGYRAGVARTRRPRRRRGVLRHYDRPLWRDRMFWVVAVPSVLITAALVGLLLVVGGVPDDAIGWIRPALVGVVVLLLAFRLLGAGVTTTRHFQRGMGEGTARRESAMEARGRVAGRAVGSALHRARTTRAGSPDPTATPTPAPPPAPEARPATEPPRPSPLVEPARTTDTDVAPAPTATPAPPTTPAPAPTTAAAPDEPTTAPPEPTASPARAGDAGPATPAPAADTPAPKVTADAAARVAGAMVGRRLAERRRRRDQPPT